MTVPRDGPKSGKGKARKKLELELTGSPFAAYTNPNAPVITVVKHSGVFLDGEYGNATPDTLAVPMEFIIDEESLDIPENTADEEPNVVLEKKALDPREYQMELFEKAKKENIIAVLDTGSGKTLIAVMLLKEMERIEKIERETRKKVVKIPGKYPQSILLTNKSVLDQIHRFLGQSRSPCFPTEGSNRRQQRSQCQLLVW
jgi:hypothetical protein